MVERRGRAVPANLRPYVEALGLEEAEHFFLKLGGSQIYVPKSRCQERGMLFEVLGDTEKVMALARTLDPDGFGCYVKVPLASEWVAEGMYRRGMSSNDIARTIRTDVSTVRRWLTGTAPAFPQEKFRQPA